MRRHLHTIALILFVLVFLFDLVLWGAVPGLPDVGTSIERSAHAEAVLASLYLALGVPLDAAVGALHSLGTGIMTAGLGPGFERILAEPHVAMDLIFSSSFNATHGHASQASRVHQEALRTFTRRAIASCATTDVCCRITGPVRSGWRLDSCARGRDSR